MQIVPKCGHAESLKMRVFVKRKCQERECLREHAYLYRLKFWQIHNFLDSKSKKHLTSHPSHLLALTSWCPPPPLNCVGLGYPRAYSGHMGEHVKHSQRWSNFRNVHSLAIYNIHCIWLNSLFALSESVVIALSYRVRQACLQVFKQHLHL